MAQFSQQRPAGHTIGPKGGGGACAIIKVPQMVRPKGMADLLMTCTWRVQAVGGVGVAGGRRHRGRVIQTEDRGGWRAPGGGDYQRS